ncbi:ribonuclease III [Rarobacter faecitabidus]|uniref:Ribonuclease 3 n=1 Tax=Rarobacter faecitabidus TaxID=13243 RepID=A0A542ZUW1_RARFA|nr:ribonuclease III [Rarobacter faecitabidus]TQL64089.1 RNAse III [Rarobacter faecitabidus]
MSGLYSKLGVDIDPELVVLALTHRSFAHEAGGIPTNERLEFLGDTVLGLVVTEALYRRFPDLPEGDLARMRAATVSQRALAIVAREIGLGSYILLGRGEAASGGADKDSILSDTVEALLGAAYLCHGLEVSRTLVHSLVDPLIEAAAELGAGLDWKTSLQELSAEQLGVQPVYRVEGIGPDHAREFTALVLLGDEIYGTGVGTAKKHAEQAAAQAAYKELKRRIAGEPFVPDEPLTAKSAGSKSGTATTGTATTGTATTGK